MHSLPSTITLTRSSKLAKIVSHSFGVKSSNCSAKTVPNLSLNNRQYPSIRAASSLRRRNTIAECPPVALFTPGAERVHVPESGQLECHAERRTRVIDGFAIARGQPCQQRCIAGDLSEVGPVGVEVEVVATWQRKDEIMEGEICVGLFVPTIATKDRWSFCAADSIIERGFGHQPRIAIGLSPV
jgi:hypothetical protein